MRCFIATAFYFLFRICHWKRPGNLVLLKLNGTHQLLVYADDVNQLEDYLGIVKK
jgi:hypothetical protein